MKRFFKNEFLITTLLTAGLSIVAYVLLMMDLIAYGFTLFIIIPVCIGYFVGQRPTLKMTLIFALQLGIILFFILLVTLQLEVFICIVLLSPLILIVMFIGTTIGYWLRKSIDKKRKNNDIKLSMLPLVVLLFAGTFEHYFVNKYTFAQVTTKMFLPYSTDKVYDYIKSVDTVNTDKPLLLKLGLPVPEKCVLQHEAVGAKRTCYFGDGAIEETVTAIKPGHYLKMDVTNCTLPLPKWLKMTEAIYLFEPKGKGTVVTRITNYRTELKPRFYWGFWEAKAIEAEHEYVLNDLKRRLDGK